MPENSLDVFLVLKLFYSLQRESNGFITEKTIHFQGSRGGPTFFQGGGGVQTLIAKETHITCDFPGVGGFRTPIPLPTPHPRLDPHNVKAHFFFKKSFQVSKKKFHICLLLNKNKTHPATSVY